MSRCGSPVWQMSKVEVVARRKRRSSATQLNAAFGQASKATATRLHGLAEVKTEAELWAWLAGFMASPSRPTRKRKEER